MTKEAEPMPDSEEQESADDGLGRSGAGELIVMCMCVWVMGLVFAGVFAWILRDGLGPDMVSSCGLEAIRKTYACYNWGPWFLVSVVATIVAHVAFHRRKRR